MEDYMTNLIMNSRWLPDENGGPKYFSGSGPITYDNFDLDGYRTCSITMKSNGRAFDGYDPFIEVEGMQVFQYVMTVRTIDLASLVYVVETYDSAKRMTDRMEMNVTKDVSYEFDDVFATFRLPQNTKYVKASIKFDGKVTACTYCNPRAFAM